MTMTDKNRSRPTDDVDPNVSAQFRSLANESVPDNLNHAVLRAARREVRRHSVGAWQAAWLRPAATVAMVALTLALVLELNDVNILTSPLPGGDRTLPMEKTPDVFREVADDAAEQVREAEAAASRATQNSRADKPLSMDAGPRSGQTTMLPDVQECTEAQRSSMATWWACIESLESSGASILAERELAALLQAFPGFIEANR